MLQDAQGWANPTQGLEGWANPAQGLEAWHEIFHMTTGAVILQLRVSQGTQIHPFELKREQ